MSLFGWTCARKLMFYWYFEQLFLDLGFPVEKKEIASQYPYSSLGLFTGGHCKKWSWICQYTQYHSIQRFALWFGGKQSLS